MQTLGAWHRDAEGRLVGGATEVSSILGVGLVPVMHGDCFIEGEIGLSILSGDVICEVTVTVVNHQPLFSICIVGYALRVRYNCEIISAK